MIGRWCGVQLVCAAALLAGCVNVVGSEDEETVSTQADHLYLLGTPFTKGRVFVTFGNGTQEQHDKVQLYLENSWAKAANIKFSGFKSFGDGSAPAGVGTVFVNFKNGSNGVTSPLGMSPGGGMTGVTLVADDTDPLEVHFRYEVLHEFGHALGFAHEQERPDNWLNGQAVYCSKVQDKRKARPGGTYETSFFDEESVMSYCTGWKTFLSTGDILGAMNTYGRKPGVHGFMITSDRFPGLAVHAVGGAKDDAELELHSACDVTNPDCTFSYRNGRLVSDRDPTLFVKAYPFEGERIKLSHDCSNAAYCEWTYSKGEFLYQGKKNFAMNAWGGAVQGAPLKVTRDCTADNPDCTFTIPHVMISSVQNTALKWNAWGGAANKRVVRLHQDCDESNSDCTWTFSKGMISSDTDPSLSVNAAGGATNLAKLRLNRACTSADPDCTFTWKYGMMTSDTDKTLGVNATNGATHGAILTLNDACTDDNPDCSFFALYGGS